MINKTNYICLKQNINEFLDQHEHFDGSEYL